MAECGANGILEWAVAARPIPGESVSGDRCVVEVTETDTLLAVIDGLGHGPEAATAAGTAVDVLRENPAEPVEVLLVLCHSALARTRGAAMTIASISAASGSMSWLGVGNVEAALFRGNSAGNSLGNTSPDMALLFGGIVGHQLPTLRPHAVDLEAGDLLLMATDGIARSFTQGVHLGAAPARLADGILENLARPTDDALILAARYGKNGS
ncbi:MAG TPA: SpoIIE family protein phosphatase [Acidimicrobiales bacterium]|nr:SpoIIE family protein phosphatase [Acidimicrobiales bacterium]